MFRSDGQRRGFAIRLSLFYAALFVVYGTQLPYLSVWLQARGLTPAEIGLVTSLPLLVRLLFTPAVAMLADRSGRHTLVITILAWGALAAVLVMPWVSGVAALTVAILLFLVLVQSTMPLAETVAMLGVRDGLDYGRMRLWGSLSFVAANVLGGWWLAASGADAIAQLLAIGAALTVAAAHALPSAPAASPLASTASGPSRPHWHDGLGVLRQPRFALLLVATGAIQASHAVYYAFGTLHWQTLGIPASWYGLLWGIGVMVEVGLFALSGPAVARVGAIGLLLLGGGAAVLRWVAMSLDPPLALLLPLQAVHGLTFGATHLAAMHLITALVPETQAGTAQALHATVTSGVAMGGALMLAGHAYGAMQGGSYLLMAALAAIGLVATLALAISPTAGPKGP